jgi:hypothetical protein
MESACAWRYRHWASGGASSLSPLLSDTLPIGLVRIQSPSPDQSQSQAKPGGAGDHEVKIRSASLAAPGAPFPRCHERFCSALVHPTEVGWTTSPPSCGVGGASSLSPSGRGLSEHPANLVGWTARLPREGRSKSPLRRR